MRPRGSQLLLALALVVLACPSVQAQTIRGTVIEIASNGEGTQTACALCRRRSLPRLARRACVPAGDRDSRIDRAGRADAGDPARVHAGAVTGLTVSPNATGNATAIASRPAPAKLDTSARPGQQNASTPLLVKAVVVPSKVGAVVVARPAAKTAPAPARPAVVLPSAAEQAAGGALQRHSSLVHTIPPCPAGWCRALPLGPC
jgi:hypothetical protein